MKASRILHLLQSCSEPNWDSYGASPLDRETAARAVRWLENAALFPLVDGGIRISWEWEKPEVWVDFRSDGGFGVYVMMPDGTELEHECSEAEDGS